MALIVKAYNPSRCGDCDLCELYTDMMTEESCYKCVVTTNVVDTEKKHYTCPIIGEIPDKHGDLIDRGLVQEVLAQLLPLVITNELTDKEIGLVHRTVGAIAEMINEQEVVVEATE